MIGRINNVIEDLTDPNIELTSTLLKVQVLAHKLKNERLKRWAKLAKILRLTDKTRQENSKKLVNTPFNRYLSCQNREEIKKKHYICNTKSNATTR